MSLKNVGEVRTSLPDVQSMEMQILEKKIRYKRATKVQRLNLQRV